MPSGTYFVRMTVGQTMASLAAAGPTRIEVYSLAGQRMRTLVFGDRPAGPASIRWDGRSDGGARLAPGVYVLRLAASGAALSQKVMLIR